MKHSSHLAHFRRQLDSHAVSLQNMNRLFKLSIVAGVVLLASLHHHMRNVQGSPSCGSQPCAQELLNVIVRVLQ